MDHTLDDLIKTARGGTARQPIPHGTDGKEDGCPKHSKSSHKPAIWMGWPIYKAKDATNKAMSILW